MSERAAPLYVEARRVLLDALEALGSQRQAVVLIGAQAVYLRVGAAGMDVTVHTTDADLAILPEFLTDDPRLGDLLVAANFERSAEVGTWCKYVALDGHSEPVPIALDLMVPETVGGSGRRAARIPPHGERTARKARGIEAVQFDCDPMRVRALDATDAREFDVNVAGSAALLVAKMHKISDRMDDPRRNQKIAKDALDVLRLLRGTGVEQLAAALRDLRSASSSDSAARRGSALVVRTALEFLRAEFARSGGLGPRLAARAAVGSESADIVSASVKALSEELLVCLES